jgi:hypothetical protein
MSKHSKSMIGRRDTLRALTAVLPTALGEAQQSTPHRVSTTSCSFPIAKEIKS